MLPPMYAASLSTYKYISHYDGYQEAGSSEQDQEVQERMPILPSFTLWHSTGAVPAPFPQKSCKPFPWLGNQPWVSPAGSMIILAKGHFSSGMHYH